MKILDRYIFVSFFKTFLSVFLILMFIFLLQTIWLFISELAGKDLDISVIFRFLILVCPRLVPLVLPLSILLTSIMTFGTFAENYEFAAMKSSGISLQRAMRSLTIFIFLLSITAFFFANNVIPAAERKFINLRKNIVQLKPARVIAANQFNEIGTYNIKVAEKYGDNDQYLRDVIIHEKSNTDARNYTVIKAKDGELIGGEKNSNLLTLILNDGNYYNEIPPNSIKNRQRKPFVKSAFDKYEINIDLSTLDNVDLNDEGLTRNHKMLNINELRKDIDSFSVLYNEDTKVFRQSFYDRSGVPKMDSKMNLDSTRVDTIRLADQKINDSLQNRLTTKEQDSIRLDTVPVKPPTQLFDIYTLPQKIQIASMANGNVETAFKMLENKEFEIKREIKRLNKLEIALHEKYVLGVACFILFFIGAPLGAIIRKGGMGLPMVVAIGFFLTYHFIGIFAKNSAEDGSLAPVIASWLATVIILPIGVLLTYRATTDQGLFVPGEAFRSIKNFFTSRFKKKKN